MVDTNKYVLKYPQIYDTDEQHPTQISSYGIYYGIRVCHINLCFEWVLETVQHLPNEKLNKQRWFKLLIMSSIVL